MVIGGFPPLVVATTGALAAAADATWLEEIPTVGFTWLVLLGTGGTSTTSSSESESTTALFACSLAREGIGIGASLSSDSEEIS